MTGRRAIADHMSHRHRTVLGAHVSNDAMSARHLKPMCEIVEAARTQQNFVKEMLDGILSDIRDHKTVWSAWPREGAKRAANLAGAVVRNVAHPDGVVTSNAQGIVLVTPNGLQTPRNNWGRMHHEITVAGSLDADETGGGVFAAWVVECSGDTLDAVGNLMRAGGLPREWEPPSVQRAKEGWAEAVEAQERCYELSFAIQEACKGAQRLCAGLWAQLRVDMQMDDAKILMHDRNRPSWSIPVDAFRAEPPPPRRVVVYDLRPEGSLFTQVTAMALMTVVVVVGFGTVKLTIESIHQRTSDGATETSFVDIILAHGASVVVPPSTSFSVTREGHGPPHVWIPAGAQLNGRRGIPVDPESEHQAAASQWASYAAWRYAPEDEAEPINIAVFEFGDAFSLDDCGAAYPAVPSAVGPVYSPVNQDGNPANSDGGGYGGCYWTPREDARAGSHFKAAWDNLGSGWGSWTLPTPYSWWGVPQNMDASTPLDASQIPGLTPASFMFAYRAW